MSELASDSVDFGENKSDERKEAISKITIHHMAGNFGAKQCANSQLKSKREVSTNYYIGTDGTIVSGVKENRRAWSSSNKDNDQKAITIEVANDSEEPNWTVSDKAFNSLINLCVDICKRYNITLNWTGDSNGTLTTHDMFKKTKCPGPYLKGKMGDIAKTVNSKVKENQ